MENLGKERKNERKGNCYPIPILPTRHIDKPEDDFERLDEADRTSY